MKIIKRLFVFVFLVLTACNVLNSGARIPKEAEALIPLTITDLSKRTGLDETDISVWKVQNKTWSDSSLGCPEPGMFYAQVITKGYKIILKVDDRYYEYHGTNNGTVVYCSPN